MEKRKESKGLFTIMMIGKQGEGTQKRTEMCERGVVSSSDDA